MASRTFFELCILRDQNCRHFLHLLWMDWRWAIFSNPILDSWYLTQKLRGAPWDRALGTRPGQAPRAKHWIRKPYLYLQSIENKCNEDLVVNPSAFSFVLCFKAVDYSDISNYVISANWTALFIDILIVLVLTTVWFKTLFAYNSKNGQ